MKILFASGNPHKRDELGKILKGHELILPKELGLNMEVEETGTTYIENALIKAQHLYNQGTGLPVLADDSGISVEALNGAPGVYSARYGDKEAGRVLSSEEKNTLLLKNIKGETNRNAAFICCMALIIDSNRVITVQEAFEGVIAEEPYGNGGFGYDPIFFLPKFGKTAAELSDDEKNRVSHRGRAGEKISMIIKEYDRNTN